MTQAHREALSARVVLSIRLTFVVLGLASMVLGYLGLSRYVDLQILAGHRPVGDNSASNIVYYDIELFLVQSTPLTNGGPVPWQLEIARFAAPCVALYTLAEIGAAVFATRFHQFRLRRARGHVVVCGSTRSAKVLAARLRAGGSRVIVVESAAAETDRVDRDALPGDPTLPRALTAVGAHRAARLYACLELGEQNAQIADAAEQVRRKTGHPGRVQVLIPDLELCTALRARRWSLPRSGAQHMGFFNPDEIAAQMTVRADDAAFDTLSVDDANLEIAIVGTGAFARSVLVEFARQCAARGLRRQALRVELIGQDAKATAASLLERYAFLAEACHIRPRDEALDLVLAERRDDPAARRFARLYLCQEDENEALTAALDQAAHLLSAFEEIVVRLDRMAGMAAAFRADRGAGGLVDSLDGRLRLADVTDVSCDPAVIDDDLAEWLARACHQRYLTERLRAGAVPGSAPVLVRWEKLSEEYRAANRDQAMDIGRKLAEIGCLIGPRRAGGSPFEYRGGEVALLAELEHGRWVDERGRRGWRHGGAYDLEAKRHPDLVPWSALPASRRELDYQAVRDIPAMLADAGLAIIRVRPATGDEPESTVSPAAPLPARSP